MQLNLLMEVLALLQALLLLLLLEQQQLLSVWQRITLRERLLRPPWRGARGCLLLSTPALLVVLMPWVLQ